MKKMEHRINRGVLFIPLFIGGVLLFSLAVMLLWNAILPAVTGVKAITYLQAIGLLILSKILFGFNKGWGGRHYQWKQRMEEKLHNMTSEEREKFKSEWKNRCGGRWGRFDKTDTQTSAAE